MSQFIVFRIAQSFFAGLAASGILTSGLRLVTKAVFDKTENGLRKGVSKSLSPSKLFGIFLVTDAILLVLLRVVCSVVSCNLDFL